MCVTEFGTVKLANELLFSSGIVVTNGHAVVVVTLLHERFFPSVNRTIQFLGSLVDPL